MRSAPPGALGIADGENVAWSSGHPRRGTLAFLRSTFRMTAGRRSPARARGYARAGPEPRAAAGEHGEDPSLAGRAARGTALPSTNFTSHCANSLRSDSWSLYDSDRCKELWRDELPSVRFAWNPTLVALRREVCPDARWQKRGRHWDMHTDDARMFLHAAHARLEFTKCHAQVHVDDVVWVVGFVQGAPYRLTAT